MQTVGALGGKRQPHRLVEGHGFVVAHYRKNQTISYAFSDSRHILYGTVLRDPGLLISWILALGVMKSLD